MNSQRLIFAISLILSLCLHVAMIEVAVRYGGYGSLYRSPITSTSTRPIPVAEPRTVFGLKSSPGESNDTSISDLEQTSTKEWRDQAFLSRDPVGEGGLARPRPVAPPMPPTLVTPPEKPLAPVGSPSNPLALAAKQARAVTESKEQKINEAAAQAKPVQPAPQRSPETSAPETPAPQTPPQPEPQQSADRAPGLPATPTDRDSDLFAKKVAAEMVNGKVVARTGRQIKFAHPRTNLAALVDSATISFPALIKMLIDVDETGSVRKVRIIMSSGSSSVDRAFELAAYESWFEPAIDAGGKPVRDQVEFALLLH